MVVLQKKLRANTPQIAKTETQSKFQLHREVSNESLQAHESVENNTGCVHLLPQYKDIYVMLTADM